MFSPVTVLQRRDGSWIVVLVGDKGPMEFLCETEDQARAFAANLSKPERPRPLSQAAPAPSGWLGRFRRAG